jgi:hypothetical protein
MKLKVSHFPQIPCEPFEVNVNNIDQALFIMDTLANYDLFQYENKIKPDYCNTTCLSMWDEDSDGEGNPDWVNWYDEEGNDIDAYELIDGKAVLR